MKSMVPRDEPREFTFLSAYRKCPESIAGKPLRPVGVIKLYRYLFVDIMFIVIGYNLFNRFSPSVHSLYSPFPPDKY